MTMYMCQDTGLELLTYSDVPDDFVCPEGWVLMTLAERDALSATRTAMAELRTQRDKLLVASDWTQVADAPVIKHGWAAYRQALRVLPETYSGTGEIPWPIPPGDSP